MKAPRRQRCTRPSPPAERPKTSTPTSVDREDVEAASTAIREFKAARELASYVIASGVLVPRQSDAIDVATDLADKQGADRWAAVLHRFEEAGEIAGVPAMMNGSTLSDAFFRYASCRARAAYLLGLAVGQQLGPNAFQGGDR